MRITRMDLEGTPGHYATITRRTGSDQIEVTILTPDQPEGRVHHVQADCEEDLWSMAECLQHHLDGHRGTNSMIHDYLRELQRFAD
ncbi:MAG TPA: hypothetical protein VF184_12350 [Phycisphaeraceae bacterium]